MSTPQIAGEPWLGSPATAVGNRAGDDVTELADVAHLLVSCSDQPGIVAAITGFLFAHGANIVQSDQYSTDSGAGRFFLRVVFRHEAVGSLLAGLQQEFGEQVARRFGMDFRFRRASVAPRVAIFVSKYDHCLLDLLWRWRRGDLPVDIGLVISNHPDLRKSVEEFGVPFEHVPVTRANKAAAEHRQLDLLRGRFDLVVLARYMQILSADMLARLDVPAINIHHSFLPAFAGANPYVQAKQRGVKLIGATAHYVTEDLDEGPIIEQDVIRVTHSSSSVELSRLGADIERTVLARAVAWHCSDRVMVNGRQTIVF